MAKFDKKFALKLVARLNNTGILYCWSARAITSCHRGSGYQNAYHMNETLLRCNLAFLIKSLAFLQNV